MLCYQQGYSAALLFYHSWQLEAQSERLEFSLMVLKTAPNLCTIGVERCVRPVNKASAALLLKIITLGNLKPRVSI